MKVKITCRNEFGWTTFTGELTKETADSYYVGQVRILKDHIVDNGFEVLPNEKKKQTSQQGNMGVANH